MSTVSLKHADDNSSFKPLRCVEPTRKARRPRPITRPRPNPRDSWPAWTDSAWELSFANPAEFADAPIGMRWVAMTRYAGVLQPVAVHVIVAREADEPRPTAGPEYEPSPAELAEFAEVIADDADVQPSPCTHDRQPSEPSYHELQEAGGSDFARCYRA